MVLLTFELGRSALLTENIFGGEVWLYLVFIYCEIF